MKRFLIVTAMAMLMVMACPGCSMFQPKDFKVTEQWVRADRATFDLIAPTLILLADADVSNDPDLTGVNGLAMLQLIDAWEVRLQAAENSLISQ